MGRHGKVLVVRNRVAPYAQKIKHTVWAPAVLQDEIVARTSDFQEATDGMRICMHVL